MKNIIEFTDNIYVFEEKGVEYFDRQCFIRRNEAYAVLVGKVCLGLQKVFGDYLYIPEQAERRLRTELFYLRENYLNLVGVLLKAKAMAEFDEDNIGAMCSGGLIGASFIAYLLGITKLNPLMPYYYCQVCGHSESFLDGEVESVFDLPRKICPKCGQLLCMGGQNIPFESFIGTDDESISKIKLEFSSDIAEAEFIKLFKDKYIDFDIVSNKALDVLLEMEAYTNVLLDEIDLSETKVYKLFVEKNTAGIWGFDTDYIKNMLSYISVEKFSDLVKINGLAHGVGTWENNGESLIKAGVATIGELITSPEDVYLRLISCGIEKKEAYRISQLVKKGRFEKESSEEDTRMLTNAGVPEWYIESMKKIEYLIPKTQTVMNAINAARLAWFKVHYPKAFKEACESTKNI